MSMNIPTVNLLQSAASKLNNVNHVYELSAFGKQLMAWHSQRPNISYGEEINNLSDCLKLTDADYTDRYSAD